MASKESKDGGFPELVPVEELRERCATPDAVYHGVAAAESWKPGKQVTMAAYSKAVDRFLSGPISGKKVIENA
ncbi:hypothetical protein J6TS7_02910 [Paenibacillus dendritiformis]|uniref:hypothetical protein n=1 Tax=Paenibacillus TaxID=44249 RepID=UPI001B008C40|nr:hypothetical protein [Paenibacillus dendritiformis]GIO76681.1 hypothetical protein J6TS7_02910 [Paenibacillus dendritiformis]